MSVNYAAGLSYYPHKGKCGQPEYFDADADLINKISQLSEWLRNSNHCVVLTGAGISTSTGIPDFRGPNGVWTLEQKGENAYFNTTFDGATPSLGHMALVALEKAGFVKYLITQNVDGLHIRTGFPRDSMSILHGDMFIEQCDKCNHQFIMERSVKTMGLKHTGNKCMKQTRRGNSCRGRLKDTILDWEDTLPNEDLDAALENCKKADLCLVLGSSLQILPAGKLPLLCARNGGKFISVNLQKTKYHSKTDLVIHSHIDKVLKQVCEHLSVEIPDYTHPTPRLYSTNSKTTLYQHHNHIQRKPNAPLESIRGKQQLNVTITYNNEVDLKKEDKLETSTFDNLVNDKAVKEEKLSDKFYDTNNGDGVKHEPSVKKWKCGGESS